MSTKKEPNPLRDYAKLITEVQELSFLRDKGFNYTYITLNEIIEKTMPIIVKNNFVLSWTTDQEGVTTFLRHVDDVNFTHGTTIPVKTQKEDAQALGSALTYARRYGVQQVLCIAADKDDDGVATKGNASKPSVSVGKGKVISEAQKKKLWAIAHNSPEEVSQSRLDWLGSTDLDSMRFDTFEGILKKWNS